MVWRRGIRGLLYFLVADRTDSSFLISERMLKSIVLAEELPTTTFELFRWKAWRDEKLFPSVVMGCGGAWSAAIAAKSSCCTDLETDAVSSTEGFRVINQHKIRRSHWRCNCDVLVVLCHEQHETPATASSALSGTVHRLPRVDGTMRNGCEKIRLTGVHTRQLCN